MPTMSAVYEDDADVEQWYREMVALREELAERLAEVLGHYRKARPAAEAIDDLLGDYAPEDAGSAEVPALRAWAEKGAVVFAREPGDRREIIAFDGQAGHWWWVEESAGCGQDAQQAHEQLVWAVLRHVVWGDEEALRRCASWARFAGDQSIGEGLANLCDRVKTALAPEYEVEVRGREIVALDEGEPAVQFRPERSQVSAEVFVDFEEDARELDEDEARLEAEALLDSVADRHWSEGDFEFVGGDTYVATFEDGTESLVYRGWMGRSVGSLEEAVEAMEFALGAERDWEMVEPSGGGE